VNDAFVHLAQIHQQSFLADFPEHELPVPIPSIHFTGTIGRTHRVDPRAMHVEIFDFWLLLMRRRVQLETPQAFVFARGYHIRLI
jgi:hypothetical protein